MTSVPKPKLLVLELWQLGDLVMATPFLQAASRKYAVTLVAKPHALELRPRFWPEVEVLPFVAPWTAFEHKYRFYAWPWLQMLRMWRALHRQRFDLGLSVRPGDARDHLLLMLARVKHRFGFPYTATRLLLNHPLDRPTSGEHRYDHWRVLAEAVGLEIPPRQFIALPTVRRGSILIHTGAAQPVRVWPLERVKNVVACLRQRGYAVQVACDSNQRDWWLKAGETSVSTPRTISELLEQIDHAAVFIGNDSGPGHVAAFTGIPTFTLFGPQLPELFAPLHPESVWIEGNPCRFRPCSDYCRFPAVHCLWDLDENAVWPRVEAFVQRHEPAILKQIAPAPATEPQRRGGNNEIHCASDASPDLQRFPVSTAKSPPIRVLHINNSADIYGASRMLLRFIKCVDRKRIEPVVVLPEPGPLKNLIEREGVEVILHPRLSIITRKVFGSWRIVPFFLVYPFSVAFLSRLIRRRRIDIVHTNTGVMISPALAARLAGAPHIWHVRDWFQEFQKIWPAFSWYVRKFSCRVVGVSNAVANQFEPRGSALVIHDGFSLEEFRVPRAKWREEFRTQHGLTGTFVVGCVGRIKYIRKGQEILVQATAALKRRGRPIKALIVGAPFPGNESHLAQLQELVRELGLEKDVVLTGELPDTRPAYAAMDVLALTSAQPEPFGGVVMEAMAMELPVVATNIGGSLDQVVEGVTGLLVPPAEPEALADAIEKLMNDPALCRRMGQAGMKRINDHFSLGEMTRQLEQLFETTVRENKNFKAQVPGFKESSKA